MRRFDSDPRLSFFSRVNRFWCAPGVSRRYAVEFFLLAVFLGLAAGVWLTAAVVPLLRFEAPRLAAGLFLLAFLGGVAAGALGVFGRKRKRCGGPPAREKCASLLACAKYHEESAVGLSVPVWHSGGPQDGKAWQERAIAKHLTWAAACRVSAVALNSEGGR